MFLGLTVLRSFGTANSVGTLQKSSYRDSIALILISFICSVKAQTVLKDSKSMNLFSTFFTPSHCFLMLSIFSFLVFFSSFCEYFHKKKISEFLTFLFCQDQLTTLPKGFGFESRTIFVSIFFFFFTFQFFKLIRGFSTLTKFAFNVTFFFCFLLLFLFSLSLFHLLFLSRFLELFISSLPHIILLSSFSYQFSSCPKTKANKSIAFMEVDS